ncbi:MAG TPA: HDIG domain-containing protein [Rectinemataceae bacterium]|nr:HDIG domain-containing protein [Rectinemataceae bacterium]
MSRSSEGQGEGPQQAIVAMIRSWKADRNRLLAVAGFAFAAVIVIVVLGIVPGMTVAAPNSIAVGKVAPVDVVAVRKATYVDEKATSLRIEAEERLTLPIFEMDTKATRDALDRYASFRELLGSLLAAKTSQDTLFLKLQRDFPGTFSRQDVAAILGAPTREQDLADAEAILARLLDRGVFALPSSGLDRYSTEYIELRRGQGPLQDSAELRLADVVTLSNIQSKIREEEDQRRISKASAPRVTLWVKKFAVANVFFSADASERRLDSAVRQVDSVTRTIAPGERLLRKGLVISEADFARYNAAREALSRPEWGRMAGDVVFVLIVALLALLLLGKEVSGVRLEDGEALLAASGIFLSWLVVVVVTRQSLIPDISFVAFVAPGALLSLVFAVFSGQRFAMFFGLVLSLAVLGGSGYDPRAFLYSFLATSSAAFLVRHAESRIDLVKAGLGLAAMEAIGSLALTIPFVQDPGELAIPFAFGGANGFASALLALWAFPVLEQLLNATTRFRLIELSDLNAPALQRLLAAAPGTYSHSIAVAHLAETACREIGADPLLARVGAYYHDIGKAEQPEYFVENQGAYNRHDEINPRLSATVIRSHVKLGVEKARALGLPEAVIAIVAEHHGSGLISWFYDRANKGEEADPEDFSYPGEPPSSREAAVIMLADAAEAAARTIKKPTPARLDGLIKDIVFDRFKQGQLDRCELTFRDLETIRDVFTRILAGQHHARIEYPRSKEE